MYGGIRKAVNTYKREKNREIEKIDAISFGYKKNSSTFATVSLIFEISE